MHVIYFFLECSCVALCIAIQFQTQEGPLPLVLLWDCVCLLVSTKHNIYCCLVFFVWLNVAWSCYQLLNISQSSKVAGATVDWIAYSQMNGSNSSGSCESIAYPLSWERCCGSNPRDSPIHSMGFLSRILLQGELLAKQKEIIIELELGDRMLENKRLVYTEPYDYIPLPSSNFRSTPYLIERRL